MEWASYDMTLHGDHLIEPCNGKDLSKFRATLGHKANHSFKKENAESINVYHPRYGSAVGLWAIKDIPKGGTIWINYKYSLDVGPTQLWYYQVYEEEVGPLTGEAERIFLYWYVE